MFKSKTLRKHWKKCVRDETVKKNQNHIIISENHYDYKNYLKNYIWIITISLNINDIYDNMLNKMYFNDLIWNLGLFDNEKKIELNLDPYNSIIDRLFLIFAVCIAFSSILNALDFVL